MNSPSSVLRADSQESLNSTSTKAATNIRSWRAELNLALEERATNTALTRNQHYGPLRVQRPFYPEDDGCAHIYLLHPPGGMVLGDKLEVSAQLGRQAKALMTTPSAAKFYRCEEGSPRQIQRSSFSLESGAQLEWLPQETIIFSGAKAQIDTHINFQSGAQFFAWDIIVLGRPACRERFESGQCLQNLQVHCDGTLLFAEKNCYRAGDKLLEQAWGLQGFHTAGTFLANLGASKNSSDLITSAEAQAKQVLKFRDHIDHWLEQLEQLEEGAHNWGITVKGALLIARYLGEDAAVCKRGFEWLWQQLRPLTLAKPAVVPRIWYT